LEDDVGWKLAIISSTTEHYHEPVFLIACLFMETVLESLLVIVVSAGVGYCCFSRCWLLLLQQVLVIVASAGNSNVSGV
jgi:hypothetical protein